ncbi:MAG TPA: hypothetical protein VLJ86_12785 [Ramlibacter sp.]|nr:hypothetical protein [Ramlibacter sp.]
MSLETTSRRRVIDAPRDKPQVDRVEHANLDRPGAHLHPRANGAWDARRAARGWDAQPGAGWRLH